VDEDVDAAELFAHDVRYGRDRRDLGDVERVRRDRRLRGLLDVARGFRQRLRPARADEHLDALARERARRLQADALAAAGDQRLLACKPQFHRAASPGKSWNMSPSRTGAGQAALRAFGPKL